MTLTIELTAELFIALEKQAEAKGVSAEGLAQQVLAAALSHSADGSSEHPLQTDRGIASPTLSDLRQKIVEAGGAGMSAEYLDEEIRSMRRSSIG